MAAFVIVSEYVAVNSVDLSTYVKSATLNCELSTEDSTTMTDTWSEHVAGIRSASLDIEFVDDFANGLLDDLQWALFIADAAVTFEVRPTSSAVGTSNPKFTGSLFVNGHSVGGAHGSLAMKSVSYPVTGAVTRAEA